VFSHRSNHHNHHLRIEQGWPGPRCSRHTVALSSPRGTAPQSSPDRAGCNHRHCTGAWTHNSHSSILRRNYLRSTNRGGGAPFLGARGAPLPRAPFLGARGAPLRRRFAPQYLRLPPDPRHPIGPHIRAQQGSQRRSASA
jgi:hypothetical protein